MTVQEAREASDQAGKVASEATRKLLANWKEQEELIERYRQLKAETKVLTDDALVKIAAAGEAAKVWGNAEAAERRQHRSQRPAKGKRKPRFKARAKP